jgi:catechol 2,3-dioxygenase-like lactoylglutathione lyase family enzyme
VFDHVTLRVPDLAAAERRFQALLDPLAADETLRSNTLAAWTDFIITEPDAERAPTRRAHVAFVAPTRDAVQEFWQAGIDAGLRDDGPPGPRPDDSDDYYAAFLRDELDNSFEAVVRDGHRRGGNVDHVALRVADLAAATRFYRTISAAAGFDVRAEEADRSSYAGRESGGLLVLMPGPATEGVHLAFPGDDDAVQRFYEGAMGAGHHSNGEPGERPRYHPGYYAAYVFDPDGNNVEVVNHQHAPGS